MAVNGAFSGVMIRKLSSMMWNRLCMIERASHLLWFALRSFGHDKSLSMFFDFLYY